MTDKELRKMRRQDLLKLLLEERKENDTLRQALAEANQRLEDREILFREAGSLAEVCVNIYKLMNDAQKAADLYLENIYRAGAKLQEAQTPESSRKEERE